MFIILDKTTNKIVQTIDKNYGIQTSENQSLQEILNETLINKINSAYDYTLSYDKDGNVTDINITKTIEQWKSEQHAPTIQPTQQDLLNAKLLKDNANIQMQLQAQQKLNADLLLKVTSLRGK